MSVCHTSYITFQQGNMLLCQHFWVHQMSTILFTHYQLPIMQFNITFSIKIVRKTEYVQDTLQNFLNYDL